MEKLKASEGFIGYFDILGYQVFLENNSPEHAANHILSSLLKLEEEVPKQLLAVVETAQMRKWMEPIIRNIKFLVFSDTVLLSLKLEGGHGEQSDPHALCFLAASAFLWR